MVTETVASRTRTTERRGVLPRVGDLEGVPFSGFGPENGTGAAWAKGMIEKIGIGLSNINSVSYKLNPKDQPGLLGRANRATGGLEFFQHLSTIDKRAFLRTFAHEQAHLADCFLLEHIDQYGLGENGVKEWEAAQSHAIAISKQTLETRRFLNPYQKHLYGQLQRGEINEIQFMMETHTIMIELAYDKPGHLRQKQEAQRSALDRQGRLGEYVAIIGDEDSDKAVGVERTILAIRGIEDDVPTLRANLAQLRGEFDRNPPPLGVPNPTPFSLN